MRKLFVFISIVFFLTGCFNRKTLSPVIENPSAHMRSIFNLKDTASFRYIRLETTNASIFGNCNKILVNDSMVFVVDKEQTKAVYCFDLSGKFRGKINAQRRGPGEYLRLSDVQLKEDTVVILDVFSAKLIYYNLEGKYLRELIFKDHRSDPFVFLPDNRIVFYQGKSGKTKANDEVIIASVHGEILSGLYPRIDLTDKDRLFHSEFYFAQNQKGTFFIPVFDDRIYLLKNDALIPVYDFSIKDKMMNRINIGHTELTQIKNIYSYFLIFS